MHRLRAKLTYSNVVASIALFVALGGTSYGLATGVIGSREIKDNTVRSKDVRNNSLTGRDINERTIRSSPRIYTRNTVTRVTLPGFSIVRTDCNRRDKPISGTVQVGGGMFGVRTSEFLTPSAYNGTIVGEPGTTGQTRDLKVTAVCLARARR